MNSDVTRRDFMKTTGAVAGATAAFSIAAGYSPLTYAQNSTIKIACIGTGGQGSFHLQEGLAHPEGMFISAVCDCYKPHQQAGVKYATASNGDKAPNVYFNYHKMLDAEKDLDAVVIATPLDTHYQIAADCLDANKFVFCEKTMCYSIEEGRNLVKKAHEKGKFVQVGHQRRYNPNYNLAMKMARDDNALGRITHIDMQWHRNTNWRRAVPEYTLSPEEAEFIKDMEKHLNWRIYRDRSGGLCTELLTHQIDIATWFMGQLPARVYGTGGLDYWRDGRTIEDNMALVYDYEMTPESPGFGIIDARSASQKLNQINKPYTVRVAYTSIMSNAKRGASELIQGDEGSVELTENDCFFTMEDDAADFKEAYKAMMEKQKNEKDGKKEDAAKPAASAQAEANMITEGKTRKVSNTALLGAKPLKAEGSDTTADVHQFRAFAHHIKNGGKPRTNEMVGLQNTILSVCALQAIREHKIVEIDPAFFKFDFEVPSIIEYNKDVKPLKA